jgi:hypothetical protein
MIAISRAAGVALTLLLCAGSAQASVQISSDATQNINCNAGICTATSKNAVLNVTDLTAMLSSADITVKSGKSAVTIGIVSPFAWTSTHRLTLDAELNVNIRAQVMVEGTAGLTIVTNDGGTGGDLMFYPGGQIDFWDTRSSLNINGNSYVLVGDLKTLIKDIHGNLEGFYALANDYDSHHRKFNEPPITEFLGTFEGLGNSIANLDIEGPLRHKTCEGMFGFTGKYDIAQYATIRDFNLKNVHVFDARNGFAPDVGALVGCNFGSIVNASADGDIVVYGGEIGGLVGSNWYRTIARSRSAVLIAGSGGVAGGLVGGNFGGIDRSYATGNVSGEGVGGLVGADNGLAITNCYATGAVAAQGQFWGGGFAGEAMGWISASYSMGLVTNGSGIVGGFIGKDLSSGGIKRLYSAYWDLETSGISDPSQGAGNISNDPGITGLTDAQLKSGLPARFDPKIWAQSASINNGYPYLIANPP